MRARLALLLVMIVMSVPLYAEEDVRPSLELLEFLGSWEDAQGNWMDPQVLQQETPLDDEETQNESGNGQANE